MQGHTQGIEHVKVSPDGRWVVSGSQDGVVKVRILLGLVSMQLSESITAEQGVDQLPVALGFACR
jgi:WD40 repeat protein